MRMSALLVTRVIREFKTVFVMFSDLFPLAQSSWLECLLHLILINSVEFVAVPERLLVEWLINFSIRYI